MQETIVYSTTILGIILLFVMAAVGFMCVTLNQILSDLKEITHQIPAYAISIKKSMDQVSKTISGDQKK